MEGTHRTIDTVAQLQNKYQDELSGLKSNNSMEIEMPRIFVRCQAKGTAAALSLAGADVLR